MVLAGMDSSGIAPQRTDSVSVFSDGTFGCDYGGWANGPFVEASVNASRLVSFSGWPGMCAAFAVETKSGAIPGMYFL